MAITDGSGVALSASVGQSIQLPFVSLLTELNERANHSGNDLAYRFIADQTRSTDITTAQSWTWGEVRDRARGVARELAGQVADLNGARVLLAFPAGLDFIAAFLGCLWAGAVPVPVAPPGRRAGDTRWRGIHSDAAAAAILTSPVFHASMAELAGQEGLGPCLISSVADPASDYRPHANDPEAVSPGSDDLAFLQYTSGSTGSPKGVVVTHGMLAANMRQIRDGFGYVAGDRVLSWLPHYHDMGLMSSILMPVHLGVTSTMLGPAAFLRDPARFLELVGRLKATVIGGPDFAYEHCVSRISDEDLSAIDLSSLRLAFNGAEAIRPETLARFEQRFAPCGFRREAWVGCYGMAEATVCVTVSPPGEGARRLGVAGGDLSTGVLREGKDRQLVESGVAVEGVELAIVDPKSQVSLADGTVGEIWVRGQNLSPGYWNKPEINAEMFGRSLGTTDGWMRSGDLGALRDGRLYVTGRLKELIIIRGQNHFPQDIERTAGAAHAALHGQRVAAYPIDGAHAGGFGLACELSRAACRDPDPEPVFQAILGALGRDNRLTPSRIDLLRPGTIELTPSGKIRRFACRDGFDEAQKIRIIASWSAAGAPASAPPATAPGTDGFAKALLRAPVALRRSKLLSFITAQISDRLAADQAIAPESRFFDMGLDSASGVLLVSDLERALAIDLDPTVIYEFTTPSALTDHLLERLATPVTPAPVSPAPTAAADVTRLRLALSSDDRFDEFRRYP